MYAGHDSVLMGLMSPVGRTSGSQVLSNVKKSMDLVFHEVFSRENMGSSTLRDWVTAWV